MKSTKIFASFAAIALLGGLMIVPATANADGYSRHRQAQKDQWRDLAIGAGAIGVIGALSHNDTLTVAGAAGALYSGYRYSQESDRRGWDWGRGHDDRWDRDHRYDRDRDRWNRDHDRDRDRDHDRDRDRDHDRDRHHH